jgi:hypothetical protein
MKTCTLNEFMKEESAKTSLASLVLVSLVNYFALDMEIVQGFKARANRFLEEKKNYNDKIFTWMRDLKEMSFFLLNPKIKYSNKNNLLLKFDNLVVCAYTENWENERRRFQRDFVNTLILVLNFAPTEFGRLYDKVRANEKNLISESFKACVSTILVESIVSKISNLVIVQGRLVEAFKLFDVREFEFLLKYFDWKLKQIEGRPTPEKFLEKFREFIGLIFENAKNFKFFRKASMNLKEFYDQEFEHQLIKNKLELKLLNSADQKNIYINEKGLDTADSRLDNIVLFGKSKNADVKLNEKGASLSFILYFTEKYYIIPTHPRTSLWYKIENCFFTMIEDGYEFRVQDYNLKVHITDSVNFIFRHQKRKFIYQHFIDWDFLNGVKWAPVCHDNSLETPDFFNFDTHFLFGYQYNCFEKKFQYFLYCGAPSFFGNYKNLKSKTYETLPQSNNNLNARLNDLSKSECSTIPLLPNNLFISPQNPPTQLTAITMQLISPNHNESLFFKTPDHPQ